MSEHWDVYFCRVDEKPASILVDLGRALSAPVPDHPVMGYMSVAVEHPDENGFPGPEEYDLLGTLEDALAAAVNADGGALYVGRCVTDGHLDFFFYLKSIEGWRERLEAFMAGFPSRAWEAGALDDPDWGGYFDFLFPAGHDLLIMQNRRACRELEENGDDLSRARFIDHWLEFPGESEAAAFAGAAEAEGFLVAPAAEARPGGSDDEGEHTPLRAEGLVQVRLSRADAPEGIDEVTFSLSDLAAEYGGDYRGWACPAVLRA